MPGSFVVDEQRIRGPATHAIVIGVGHFPHLPGGGSRIQVAKPEGLEQLTSPPISARAVATWLIERYNNPDRPLASLALLVSERRKQPFSNPRTGVSHAVEAATIDNIEAALTEWRARGEAGNDQRLIFYFCGHGIAKGAAPTLLASDYGEKPNNALDGAFDFQYFRSAMALSTVSEQIYVVDACRVGSASLLGAGPVSGRPIFQGDLLAKPNQNLRAPTFYSTLPGVTAYGRKGKVSFYTEALIHGLNGAGAVNNGRGWRVTSLRLQEALDFYLERLLKGIGRTGTPPTDQQVMIDVSLPTTEPVATALITSDPADAIDHATVTITGRGKTVRESKPKNGEFVLELLPGSYQFQAEFANRRWQADVAEAYIQPVSYSVTLKVTR